eukprot:CAMPEP_0196574240 /NCGR_PEP_ID=MMETSP1081-20130531/3990_1 /TAXON_ID=36882 /ORGANISM="Pyramimonas amylifera, Strain CCMP720" /LENGTH=109 /DNA_ID=CAMNT_0041892205 /DNA_START=127 /DNA_END=453 /DNA_ORIENTATION=+
MSVSSINLSSRTVRSARFAPKKMVARGPKMVTKAVSDVTTTICVCNAAMLAIGRFVAMPYQRAQVAKAGLPVQNGVAHEEAGDSYAKEASFLQSTNDPAGFNLIDVMAW